MGETFWLARERRQSTAAYLAAALVLYKEALGEILRRFLMLPENSTS